MSKANPKKPPATPDFESALKELETLVEQLEGGELALADSLSHFERGVALSRECHDLLEQARLKVTELNNEDAPATDQDPDQESP